ncbi:YlxR family protein [Mycobacterium rhizamassiliense]|uniref:YlxR family protein n=1 Tax=Mycobacterium rhizamassiliense TaxID=1841860 RepID=UPI001C1FD7E2|nr:YlxR family protein [Mycobacterium rhizamassiliense]
MIQREPSDSAHRATGGPVRTCVGCRKRELAVKLLRVVARSAGNGEYAVIVDPASSLPGRGAWLHPELQCAQQAVRRRAFTKALRIDRPPDTSAVVEHLRALEPPGREQVAKNMSTP